MSKFTTAAIKWRDGHPYSTAFDDVYFSSDDGLLETNYVFISGNNLITRWQTLNQPSFSIIETGFGTGLNFLCAAQQWLAHSPNNATLHYTSTEKYPLKSADLQLALQHWPQLNELSAALLTQYEALLTTGACALFNGRIQLKLCLGDALEELIALNTLADAWFLDGFAPAKNPEMWQDALFMEMARLSHNASSFATFTSAGVVRRGLSAAGFQVSKKPGFGKKREMLTGIYTNGHHDN